MKIYGFLLIILFAATVRAQNFEREFSLVAANASIKIVNFHGRVSVAAETIEPDEESETSAKTAAGRVFLVAPNAKEADLKIVVQGSRLEIVVQPSDKKTRVDLILKISAPVKLDIETGNGEVLIEGDIESATVKTDTGTIAANVALDDLKYNFVWTEARPRFLSDAELDAAKEKAAGKFVVSGKFNENNESEKTKIKSVDAAENSGASGSEIETVESTISETDSSEQKQTKRQKSKPVKLNFTTARGIVLLNVNPNEVPSNLTERPLTEAAKAIVRSGDSLLTEAIRRASPKYFGEYARTLPPRKSSPVLSESVNNQTALNAPLKRVVARVTDFNNRAVSDLKREDFELTEKNEPREITAVEAASAPFNLVLLLDVSGSVDTYVDFIRKTARNFVNTVGGDDQVALIIFNEDVKTLSTFTTDKNRLSTSLDTFDAGGGTAFYDALAYTLAETLRPLKGERTAIVILSDGDDNRSFLPFDSLLGSIEESGALVYPLYVPSGLIAATAANGASSTVDPLRARYNGLTSKAETEGAKLAQISGGVYHPIRQIGDLQTAYNDIVVQLRTAYSITFRSNVGEVRGARASPRLKVRVKRENSVVRLGSVVEVSPK